MKEQCTCGGKYSEVPSFISESHFEQLSPVLVRGYYTHHPCDSLSLGTIVPMGFIGWMSYLTMSSHKWHWGAII
jgi:hypothetical protein